ncbi:MAG: methyltransferase domain-containing protein [Blastocatellia bacterium]|nr:methyltransferase domain-containing protein [Blastocatellia bacterium]
MSKRVFDDFDGFADEYRQIHNEGIRFTGADSDHFSEQKIEEVRKHETSEHPLILDLGCGDGNSAAFFQKHFAGCEYIGLDTSVASVAVAQERDLLGTTFAHYDGFKVPYPERSFDIVYIACVLHHVEPEQHKKLLSEVKRVLKSGGRLYIFEHNPLNPATQYMVKTCPFDENAVLLTSSYTRKMLRSLNFREISIDFTIFFPRHRIFRSLMRLEDYLSWLPFGGQYYARSVKGE